MDLCLPTYFRNDRSAEVESPAGHSGTSARASGNAVLPYVLPVNGVQLYSSEMSDELRFFVVREYKGEIENRSLRDVQLGDAQRSALLRLVETD
jgi:hypothetical protein